MRAYVQPRRGLEGDLSLHMLVIYKIAFCCTWYRTRYIDENVRRMRVEKSVMKLTFQQKLVGRLRTFETAKNNVKIMWRQFKTA